MYGLRTLVVAAGQPVAELRDPRPFAEIQDDLCDRINTLRDQRIAGGFEHDGHRYQSRATDRENIMGMAQDAALAIAAGAQPGDLRWYDPDHDFAWITEANELVPMDAYQVVALKRAGSAFKASLTFAARAAKNAILAAVDLDALLALDLGDWA